MFLTKICNIIRHQKMLSSEQFEQLRQISQSLIGSDITRLSKIANEAKNNMQEQQLRQQRFNEQHVKLIALAEKYMNGIVIPKLEKVAKVGKREVHINMNRMDFLGFHHINDGLTSLHPVKVVYLMIKKWINLHRNYEGLQYDVYNNRNFTIKFWY